MNNKNEIDSCTESPLFPNFCIPVSQHKLQKMTRILMDEQIKTINRIQVFKKTTVKMINDKQKEIFGLRKNTNRPDRKTNQQFQLQRIQPVVNRPPITRHLKSECSMRSLRSLKSAASSRSKEVIELAQHRRLSKKANQQAIAKQRQKDLRRNLKSAKIIRSSRENIRSAKQNYFEWKIGAVRQQNQENWQKDYNMYLEKYKKIEELKKMQLLALSEWKRSKQTIKKIYEEIEEGKE